VAEARARGAQIRLAVVGDGELRPGLEALATDLGIGDSVRFFGYRPDIPEIATATDVALLPSDREGLGAWLVEAAAAGRPAVASDVGGIPEVVAEGCGITAPAGDVGAFADALERLATDTSLRRVMGERARAHVALRFSADRMLRDVDLLYRELLAARVSG
jgi:glycosyltransferase involved in cell wall biosynthesis